MRSRYGTARIAALRKNWQRWTAIVEAFARRRLKRRWVDPREYRALHARLVDSCRVLADTSEGSRRLFFLDLEATVEPWLDVRVLERAEQEILSYLVLHCLQIERELGCSALVSAVRRGVVPLFTAAVLIAVPIVLACTAHSILFPALSYVQSWLYAVWFMVGWSGTPGFFQFAIIAIPAAILAVSRTVKS